MSEGIDFVIARLLPDDARFSDLEQLAKSILNQDRYLTHVQPHASESHILGAFLEGRAVGFLRFVIQPIGAEEGRTPILSGGSPIIEAYVEAFGVDPGIRRQGIGSALQANAIASARQAGCYQIRSQSPVTSQENYALKLAAGYVLHPSDRHDSYYFILKL